MRTISIIVYACDFEPNGTCGPETFARMKKAIEILEKEKFDFANIFFGAGSIPGTLNKTGKEAMEKEFGDFLIHQNYEPHPIMGHLFKKEGKKVNTLTSWQDVWGTFVETESIIDSFPEILKDDEVIAISSSYHIPRIKFIWQFMPKPKKIRFISILYKQSLRNQILEPLRYLKVLIYGIRKSIT